MQHLLANHTSMLNSWQLNHLCSNETAQGLCHKREQTHHLHKPR